jgi:hypothetical protein
MAIISLSPENLPNAINDATRQAIGTDKASIQAIFRTNISKITKISKPLAKTASINFTKKSTMNRNVIMLKAKMNGAICSFNTYNESFITRIINAVAAYSLEVNITRAVSIF